LSLIAETFLLSFRGNHLSRYLAIDMFNRNNYS